MARKSVFVLLLLASICAPAFADNPYFPTKQGSKWVYTTSAGSELTVRVSGGKEIDKVPCVLLETVRNGKTEANEHIAATKDGIFRYAVNGVELSTPITLLKIPFKAGEKYADQERKLGDVTINGSFISLEEKEITVPAGKYKTLVTTGTFKIKDKEAKITFYFAEGVGIVKQELVAGKDTTTLSLKEVKLEK